MIRYFGHSPLPPYDTDDFVDMAGGKITSDDGQRELFNPVHTFTLRNFLATPSGTLNVEHYREMMRREFDKGLPVITAAFPSKFAASALTERLIANPENLMVDQFGEPFVPSNTHGNGDTYFAVDHYPGGARNEFLETIERIERGMARELVALFAEEPKYKGLLIGTVVAGEMKYPHTEYTAQGRPRWFDYSEQALDAYRRYTHAMIGTGKMFRSFGTFKAVMGIPPGEMTSGVKSLVPPRSVHPKAQPYNRLPSEANPTIERHFSWWHNFRLWSLRTHIEDHARWWSEEGLTDIVYWGSQAVQTITDWRRYWSAMEPSLLWVGPIVPGISLYGKMTTSTLLLTQVQRAAGVHPGYGWNAMQWNPGPAAQGVDQCLSVLREQYIYGAQALNLHNAMPVDPGMLSEGDNAVRRWMADG